MEFFIIGAIVIAAVVLYIKRDKVKKLFKKKVQPSVDDIKDLMDGK